MVKMLLIVLLLILSTCTLATADVLCGSHVIDEPCNCSEQRLFIGVNDTVSPGTPVAFFNSTLQLLPCTKLNFTDGKLILLVDLRQPCVDEVSCYIQCTYPKEIIVTVNHVDMHDPVFPKGIFTVEMPENVGSGSLVLNFSKPENMPKDDDCPEKKSNNFFIEKVGDAYDYFGFLQPTSGELTLNKPLDFEKSAVYNVSIGVLIVNAMQRGTGYTTVIVNLQDVDDNDPVFEHLDYTLYVPEETILTTELSTSPAVRGYDKDRGINQTIWYSFADYKNMSEGLQINMEDGTFSVIKAIDRENISSFEVILWCFQSDKHEKRATSTLFVHVTDINDNLAIFSPDVYHVTLVENAVGDVTTVTATDKDESENSVIIYELVNETDTFEVDSNSGKVMVKTPADLDREETPVLTVLIRAKDNEGNYSENTATVIISLQDVNDNSPQFEKEIFLFRTNSLSVGDAVGQVKATDQDEAGSSNANVTYGIYQELSTVPFIIDELDGNLTIQGPYDRNTDYNFLVRACDNPVLDSDRRCSIARVVVLYGTNVTFVTNGMSLEVQENVPAGTLFGNKLPVTGDRYVCSTDDFDVDLRRDMMVTKTILDREMNATYDISVEVFKYSEPVGNISLTISVQDVNDNVPTFTKDEYFFNIPDTVDKNTVLGTLAATDDDVGDNANLTFSFQHTSSRLFTIDEVTGEVKFSDQWKEGVVYKQSLYHLIAEVADRGEPPLVAVTPVYVSSMKMKDSAVGIPTGLSRAIVMKDDVKKALERLIADLLVFDDVQITDFDESSSRIFVKAFQNNTEVGIVELQRSLIQNWSPVQELFRQYMDPRSAVEHSDTSLSTAEIALITISVVVFFGGLISVIIICKQWDTHVKNNRLYETLRRPSTMYDSQELRMDFSEDEPSRMSTFRGPGRKQSEHLEGSFGLGFVNTAFNCDGDNINAPTTPTWSCNDTPRVPRWSTSDSLKDAMESLDELTHRLNSEDNISRVSNMSRGRRSEKSSKSEPVTPRSDCKEVAISPQYENVLHVQSAEDQKRSAVPRYENLIIDQPNRTPVKNMHERNDEDGYDSGISEAERIQEIIDTNQDTDDYENTLAKLGLSGDIVEEESTAL